MTDAAASRLLPPARLDEPRQHQRGGEAPGGRGRAARARLIWAPAQTAGRGRRGRPWFSRAGQSLPRRRPAAPGARRRRRRSWASPRRWRSATRGAASRPERDRLTYKWPNDVLRRAAAKSAGILLESAALDGRASTGWWLGIGVNLGGHPRGHRFPATSLAAVGAAPVAPEAFLEALAPGLPVWYERWRESGFGRLRSNWLDARAWAWATRSASIWPARERRAICPGSMPTARCCSRPAGERRRIAAGEVFFRGLLRRAHAARHQRQQHQHGVRRLGRRQAARACGAPPPIRARTADEYVVWLDHLLDLQGLSRAEINARHHRQRRARGQFQPAPAGRRLLQTRAAGGRRDRASRSRRQGAGRPSRGGRRRPPGQRRGGA